MKSRKSLIINDLTSVSARPAEFRCHSCQRRRRNTAWDSAKPEQMS